ncbi:hypothetical protein [Nocardia macrotermitis]|uniref:Uncharacterized protein n=1 Tax=Nocardia macrotermitis TaxID=2585198 RepID=A0A7K0D9P6_9NOCA|nr:hypothetical protein [Nocardia macrotermitis]MQY22447.1 hypothetical protein [Nocardia macrotermitis]
MIAMSYASMRGFTFELREVEYAPAHEYRWGPEEEYVNQIAATVDLRFEGGMSLCLSLSIEDARALAEQLPQILMLHDAAERVAAEKAVA